MIEVANLLERLLRFELMTQARKMQFIEADPPKYIDQSVLSDALYVLNNLSLSNIEQSRKQLIAIAALVWQYKDPSWNGLKDYLLLFLSRAGFAPSTVMLDKQSEGEQYFLRSSLLNEVAVAVARRSNEVLIGGHTFLLTDFQKTLWNKLQENSIVGISAPTSAGKSYLILLQAMRLLLEKHGPVIYIVPTLSLVNQVLGDFRKMLDQFGLTEYIVESGINNNQINERSIYVLTQEKAIAIFSEQDVSLAAIRLLVIDEIQNIERVETAEDMRAKILYDLMIDLQTAISIDKIVLSGPRIVDIDELGQTIFGDNTVGMETTTSPVLNLTYSIGGRKNKYFFRLRTDLLQLVLETEIQLSEAVVGYGKKMYDDAYLTYLTDLLSNFDDECVLIFSPTSNACGKISDYLAARMAEQSSELLNDLSAFISQTVHSKYSLAEVVKSGVVYHHGKVPAHVRNAVEHSIKAGGVKVVVATTTLLQGVNLPVQNIFIRNPNLYVKKMKGSQTLSNYELANLRGRAGRLLKDFIGRTFILDESGFETEGQQMDLFKGAEKKIEVGYGKKYTEYKSQITADILNNIGNNASNKDYHYLSTYIRQAVTRLGINAQTYLAKVGINLTDRELNQILSVLRQIRVERGICARNRYWDPVDLYRLQNDSYHLVLPARNNDYNNAEHIEHLLKYMQEEFPVYYERYMQRDIRESEGRLQALSILASKWVNETSLAQILSGSYYNSTEIIDQTIKALEGNISYGMALLFKPIYSIHAPESSFLQYLEMGAWHPVTRKLIGLNIPRETAIYLRTSFRIQDTGDRARLIAIVRDLKPRLSYWHRVQVENI